MQVLNIDRRAPVCRADAIVLLLNPCYVSSIRRYRNLLNVQNGENRLEIKIAFIRYRPNVRSSLPRLRRRLTPDSTKSRAFISGISYISFYIPRFPDERIARQPETVLLRWYAFAMSTSGHPFRTRRFRLRYTYLIPRDIPRFSHIVAT